MELTSTDHAALVHEIICWMQDELVRNGVTDEVVIRGWYDLDAQAVLLTVSEPSTRRSTSRRTVPDRPIARATVGDSFIHGERSQGPEAVAYILRVIRSQAPHLLAEVTSDPLAVHLARPAAPVPTPEDLTEVQRILDESRARRDLRPSKPRDDGPGRSDRTTGTP